MTQRFDTTFIKDLPNKKLRINRMFDASLEDVWSAWTKREILDRWWAPRPWITETQFLNFSEGGSWHYVLRGPNGKEHWSIAEFRAIKPTKSFEAISSFCDSKGVINPNDPVMHWKNSFVKVGQFIQVEIEIVFSTETDLEVIVERGFRKGLTNALENLDEVLSSN